MSDDQRVEGPSTSNGIADEEAAHERNSKDIYELFRQNKSLFNFGSNQDIQELAVQNKDDKIYVYMTIPPDGGWGWIIVIISFLCNAIIDGICLTFGRLIPSLTLDLKLNISQAITVSSIMNGIYYLVGPVVSAIVNKVGFRIVAMVGGLISAIGIFAGSYCPDWITLALCYGFITGWGFGMVFSPSTIVVGYYFEKYRALATGIAICGSGFGTLVFSPVYDLLTNKFGWRNTLRIQAALCLVVTALSILFRPVKPARVAKIVDPAESDTSSEASNLSDQSIELEIASYSKFNPNRRSTVFSESELPIGSVSTTTVPIIPQLRKYDPHRQDDLEDCCHLLWKRLRCCKDEQSRSEIFRGRKQRDFNLVIESRPLFRRDIFYTGSLGELPSIQQPALAADGATSIIRTLSEMEGQTKSINYNMSVMHPPAVTEPSKVCHFHISPIIVQGLTLLFDFRLFSSRTFQLVLLSCFFFVVGSNIPFLCVTNRADHNHMPTAYSNWLVSLIGVSNTIFRLLAGLVSFFPRVDPTYVSATALLLGGFFTAISGFVGQGSVPFQYVYCIVFGQSSAFFNTMKQVIFVRCLGLDKLTNAFGITSLAMGIATLVGVPIAGVLMDATKNTNATFIYAGVSIVVAGILQALIPIMFKRQKGKEAREAEKTREAELARKAEERRQRQRRKSRDN